MDVQSRISAAKLAARVGRTLDVLVDGAAVVGRGKAKRTIAVARSSADAPEIDGVVHVEDGGNLAPGSFARVTVTAAGEHDLVATLAT
jgi:ribosomal protein S12 methylthiotransferase